MTWLDDAVDAINGALEAVFVKKVDRSHISYGEVDSTSTSTAFTATVSGLTTLVSALFSEFLSSLKTSGKHFLSISSGK